MKTTKWKFVVIKNSRLRQVRKNLRTLLWLAYLDEMKRFSQLEESYQQKRDKGIITRSQLIREEMLTKQSNQLISAYNQSTLRCAMGRSCKSKIASGRPVGEVSLEMDMVWNPIARLWYCLPCYNYRFSTKKARRRFKFEMLEFWMIEVKRIGKGGPKKFLNQAIEIVQYLQNLRDE